MEFKELLTTYWSQTTLILFGIAYFFKRGFDYRTRKVELNHSLFQQNRINAVNKFFSNYARVETMWYELPIYDILNHKINSKEIDKIVGPPLNDLIASVLELNLYFDSDAHSLFQNLCDEFQGVNHAVLKMYIEKDFSDDSNIIKSNFYSSIKGDAIKKNNETLKVLYKKIKQSFKTEL